MPTNDESEAKVRSIKINFKNEIKAVAQQQITK